MRMNGGLCLIIKLRGLGVNAVLHYKLEIFKLLIFNQGFLNEQFGLIFFFFERFGLMTGYP